MSDLHCAATLLVTPSDRVPALVDELAGARVAHVWSDGTTETHVAARSAAARLGVGITERADVGAHLDEVADEHRGETVLVVVGAVAGAVAGDAEVTEVRIDGDGRISRPWRG
ncbi:hypothetical protein [Nocardioides sp. MH1]|uniref:hypothetical protein n=1 Tax=Nocardioides sp. MH1 TaxID=3242490 RepID=UPI003522C07D